MVDEKDIESKVVEKSQLEVLMERRKKVQHDSAGSILENTEKAGIPTAMSAIEHSTTVEMKCGSQEHKAIPAGVGTVCVYCGAVFGVDGQPAAGKPVPELAIQLSLEKDAAIIATGLEAGQAKKARAQSADVTKFKKWFKTFGQAIAPNLSERIKKGIAFFEENKVPETIEEQAAQVKTSDMSVSKLASAKIEARVNIARNMPIPQWLSQYPPVVKELTDWATTCGTKLKWKQR